MFLLRLALKTLPFYRHTFLKPFCILELESLFGSNKLVSCCLREVFCQFIKLCNTTTKWEKTSTYPAVCYVGKSETEEKSLLFSVLKVKDDVS